MRRTAVRLAAVGGSQFQEFVQVAAHRIGGTIVAGIEPDGGEKLRALVADALERCDEFVVEATAVPAFVALNGDIIGRTRAIRIVEIGDGAAVLPGRDDPFAAAISRPKAVLKRVLDVTFALVALAVVLPMLLMAVVAIRLETRGPILFRQTRLGMLGHPFTILKLRTMHVDNDDTEHARYMHALIAGTATAHNGIFKLRTDPRITRVGRVLRRLSIDELPQLLNVLKGDMSLVGPRPPLPAEVRRYDVRAWQRLRGKPGITGLWQVSGRCELTFGEMVDLDIEYLQRWSLWRDLLILLRTPLVMLSGRGAA